MNYQADVNAYTRGEGRLFCSVAGYRPCHNADEVIAEKGYSVCYDSASSALEAFERQKFSRDPDDAEAASIRVQRMLSCDLMILDDLGTEMVTPMSLSALYTLINSRLNGNLRTIISTNCTDEELERRYTPQICSRIKGEFLELPFCGTDIRQLKRKK